MIDGLKANHRAAIIATLAANDRVERAVLFGSRAMGANTITSDVDIALFGQQLTLTDQASLAAACEELPMAQSVDLVLHSTIDNPALVEHIRSYGVEWYRRGGGDSVAGGGLGDIAEIVMGQSPPGKSCNEWGEGIPLLNGPTEFGSYHPTPVQFTTNARKVAMTGDILFCVRGSTTGRMNYADQQYAIGRGIAAIRHKTNSQLQPLIRGIVETQLSSLLQAATGSTFPNVSANQLSNLTIPKITEKQMLNIADLLKSFEDKIELNRRMNETLEAMARALFKDWFVDFGPVRAKAEGREAYLPEEVWGLFPDSFEDSELGEIPRGWGVKRLGEVVAQRRSGVKPEQINPNTPYIALEHMPKHCIALSEWGNANELASSKFRFQQGDILFGKLRPYFHKVGVAPLDGVCSTDIVVVSPKSDDWFGFTLGYLSSSDFIDYTDATSTGTRMPRTNWQNMASYKVPLPDYEIARSYTELVRSLVNKIISNIHRSHTLAAQRDALLPRLVSGKLRVSKIDIYPEKMY